MTITRAQLADAAAAVVDNATLSDLRGWTTTKINWLADAVLCGLEESLHAERERGDAEIVEDVLRECAAARLAASCTKSVASQASSSRLVIGRLVRPRRR